MLKGDHHKARSRFILFISVASVLFPTWSMGVNHNVYLAYLVVMERHTHTPLPNTVTTSISNIHNSQYAQNGSDRNRNQRGRQIPSWATNTSRFQNLAIYAQSWPTRKIFRFPQFRVGSSLENISWASEGGGTEDWEEPGDTGRTWGVREEGGLRFEEICGIERVGRWVRRLVEVTEGPGIWTRSRRNNERGWNCITISNSQTTYTGMCYSCCLWFMDVHLREPSMIRTSTTWLYPCVPNGLLFSSSFQSPTTKKEDELEI